MYELNTELVVDLQHYKESDFYKKYGNKKGNEYESRYFSDKILKEVYNKNFRADRLRGLCKKEYKDVVQINLEIMTDLFNEFSGKYSVEGRDLAWEMLFATYIDPDLFVTKQLNRIKCTADGLHSINRIYKKHVASEKTIIDYETYRKIPIFFFPSENNGINQRRYKAFGDRIDHTLFDLKNYFEEVEKGEKGNIEKCRLSSSYKSPRTSKWLKKIGSFKKLIDWYGVKGIFVNDYYQVFDIEAGDGTIITDYKDVYTEDWSDDYYNNLKIPVGKFTNKQLKN